MFGIKSRLSILLLTTIIVFADGKFSARTMNRYMQSLQMASETATSLYESLKNEKDLTAPNVIIAFVETITIIGEIVKLFTDETSDTSQQLASMKRELHVLSENQDEIIKGIKSLHSKIENLPIKNEITTRSVDINSCFKDFNNFLRQPDSKPRQDDLRKCVDTIKPGLRFIADLLKENKYTKVFEQMIKNDKLCNASNIMTMHKYMFSLYVTGCEAVITSEKIEHHGSSTYMLEECNQNFVEITDHLKQIFSRCSLGSCDDVISILNSLILLNIEKHTKVIWQDVTSNFPWFDFQVYEFTARPNITIVGNKKPNSVTFVYNATQQYFVAWTPYKTQINPNNSSLGFSFEIDSENIVNDFTSMNVTTNLETHPALVTGFVVDNPNVSSGVCIYTVRQMYAKQTYEISSSSFSGLCVVFLVFVGFKMFKMFIKNYSISIIVDVEKK